MTRHKIKFAAIGKRVARVAAIDNRTIIWPKPRTKPIPLAADSPVHVATPCMNSAESPSPKALNFGVSQAFACSGIGSTTSSSRLPGKPGCSSSIQFIHQPTIKASANEAATMPRYLPSRNCRRVTGLLISVMAVRPSISSLIEMLAARRRTARPRA